MAELITMENQWDQEFSKTQRGFAHFYRKQAKPVTIANVKKITMGKKAKSQSLEATDLWSYC